MRRRPSPGASRHPLAMGEGQSKMSFSHREKVPERRMRGRGKPDLHRFLRFRTELNDPEATATEFEREWRDFGLDRLDIVSLGIGDDGHTASLFPGTTALNVDDRIATAVHVPKLNAWRVTLTKTVIRDAALR